MTGNERRDKIVEQLQSSKTPISASKLASDYAVSRQVIVSDVALIRASGYDIISTNRGYMINISESVSRVIKVKHTDEQLRQELNAIVDLGGCVEDVFVHHKFYGTLKASLGIDSRRKVEKFIETIESGKSTPLKNITSDYHYHTVRADKTETLDIIERELEKLGFLVQTDK